MSNDSGSLPGGLSVDRTLARTSSPKITLSSIGPWSWFVCDYAIGFAFAALALSLTPWSVSIEGAVAKGDHVGRLAFCLATGLLLALAAHISGLHETNQGRTSLKLLARCALVSGLALLFLNVECCLSTIYLLVDWSPSTRSLVAH